MVILVFTATSCTKTLDLTPEDYFGDGNFWKNESQVNNFMVGMHKQFRDNQFMFLRLGEMRSGNFSNVDRQNTSLNELQIIEQRIDETSTGMSNWAGFYSPILQLNLFITRVSSVTFLSDARKQYLLGQAMVIQRVSGGNTTFLLGELSTFIDTKSDNLTKTKCTSYCVDAV